MLKETLKDKYGVEDLKQYSNESDIDNISDLHPEIYEYQNFFLLKRNDGSYLLLDGFRRLLLYNGLPNIDVNVRVYNESDLTNTQLLRLMLMLNHTKFFGGIGKYYDKGFNLLFSVLYGFDAIKFSKVFEGYVIYSQETTHNRWVGDSENRNADPLKEIKTKLLLPNTIKDLKFLYDLFKVKPCINKFNYLGSLVFKFREKYPDIEFSVDEFVRISNTPDIIKLETDCPSPRGARETDHVTKLMEFYNNVLCEMCGEEPVETYVDALARIKATKAKLKKNKNIIHLSNRTDWKKIEEIGNFVIKNRKSPKVILLAFPNLDGEDAIYPDSYDGIMNKMTISSHLMSTRLRYYCNLKDIEGYEDVENSVFGAQLKKLSKDGSHFNRDNSRNDIEIYIDLSETLDNKVAIVDYRKKD